jgi:hypothetical protein
LADPPDPDRGDGLDQDGKARPSTPRWVYVSGTIAAVFFLLFVILHLTGNGFGGHMPPTGGH